MRTGRSFEFFRVAIPPHIDVALALRGLASLAGVWWHVWGYRAQSPEVYSFTTSGRTTVWIFFALSGYLIGYGLLYGRYGFEFVSLKNYI